MIRISLSFSGKEHEGARLPRQEEDEALSPETREDFIHKQKKRKKKPKKMEAIPRRYSAREDVSQVRVRTKLWLGSRERDPAPKKSRIRSRFGRRTQSLPDT